MRRLCVVKVRVTGSGEGDWYNVVQVSSSIACVEIESMLCKKEKQLKNTAKAQLEKTIYLPWFSFFLNRNGTI